MKPSKMGSYENYAIGLATGVCLARTKAPTGRMDNVDLRALGAMVRFIGETLAASNPPGWSWGCWGQQERSPNQAIKRPVVCAWFGPGGEAGLQALVDGGFRGESQHLPSDRGIHGEAKSSWLMVVQEGERSLLLRGIKRQNVLLVRNSAQCH